MKSNNELGNFFSYRLINILYFLGLSVSFLIIIALSVVFIPERHINLDKSYVICGNHIKFSFDEVGIYSSYKRYSWESDMITLDKNDKEIAEKYCADLMLPEFLGQEKIPNITRIRNFIPVYNNLSDTELSNKIYNQFYSQNFSKEHFNNIFFAPISKNEKSKLKGWTLVTVSNIKLIYEKSGSWAHVIYLLLFGALFSYSILNILKETFIYLFIGKKFSWKWLKFWKK